MGNECAPKLCRGQISETTAATVPRMPRPLRIDVPGGIYHVVTRGNRDDLIIHDDADRIGLLGFLTKAISRFGWICDAYCLMTTHYHLLIRTPKGGLSDGMQYFNGSYAKWFNGRHRLQ
jgi:putative transposase